jgi:hypothetical protein
MKPKKISFFGTWQKMVGSAEVAVMPRWNSDE